MDEHLAPSAELATRLTGLGKESISESVSERGSAVMIGKMDQKLDRGVPAQRTGFEIDRQDRAAADGTWKQESLDPSLGALNLVEGVDRNTGLGVRTSLERLLAGNAVLLNAWTKSLKLEPFDPVTAAGFIDTYRGRGPENPVR